MKKVDYSSVFTNKEYKLNHQYYIYSIRKIQKLIINTKLLSLADVMCMVKERSRLLRINKILKIIEQSEKIKELIDEKIFGILLSDMKELNIKKITYKDED